MTDRSGQVNTRRVSTLGLCSVEHTRRYFFLFLGKCNSFVQIKERELVGKPELE